MFRIRGLGCFVIGVGGLAGVNWIRRCGVGRRCLLGFIAFVVDVGLFVG